MLDTPKRAALWTLVFIVVCAACVGIGRGSADSSHRVRTTSATRWHTVTVTRTVTRTHTVTTIKRVPYEPAACLRLNDDLKSAYAAFARFGSVYGDLKLVLLQVHTDLLNGDTKDITKVENDLFKKDDRATDDLADIINYTTLAKTDHTACLEATK